MMNTRSLESFASRARAIALCTSFLRNILSKHVQQKCNCKAMHQAQCQNSLGELQKGTTEPSTVQEATTEPSTVGSTVMRTVASEL